MWMAQAGNGREIGEAHGVSGKTVFNVLERAGLRPRKRYPKRGPFKLNPKQKTTKAPPILGTTPLVKASIVHKVKPGLFARLWAAIKG